MNIVKSARRPLLKSTLVGNAALTLSFILIFGGVYVITAVSLAVGIALMVGGAVLATAGIAISLFRAEASERFGYYVHSKNVRPQL